MKNQGKLFFFCGKMGAGKTTKSKVVAIENDAVLISEDEWLAAHFPNQMLSFDDYIKYANLIKPFINNHFQSLLNEQSEKFRNNNFIHYRFAPVLQHL